MKKIVSILSIFTTLATTGAVAISCTRSEIKEKPIEKKINPKEEETEKIDETQLETQFQNIKKIVGPKIDLLIKKLRELEKEDAEVLATQEVGALVDIFQFYEDSKSYDSLKEAVEKLPKDNEDKERSKKDFLESVKSTFDNYEKYKSKIDELIDKYVGS
ncbi:hypothetical protein [Mycoplasma yeatsii]|uniref:hypothetical protein n=1 Tax=Mycoplasma yeatsii TaxID=51365 RepID=UPI0005B23970|nr:hypothetical protein [Mycoplasma yeatsii]AJM71520.1 lipoprotein [Mycoplasma yeatsii GM274B]